MDICPNCHAGTLRRRQVTYAAWHALAGEGPAQFVVTSIPAWLCDVCGVKLFDQEALVWLMPLLGPAVDVAGDQAMAFRRMGKAPAAIGMVDQG